MNTFKRNKGGWAYSNEKGMMIINAAKTDREGDEWWLYDEKEELLGKYKTLRDAKKAAQSIKPTE